MAVAVSRAEAKGFVMKIVTEHGYPPEWHKHRQNAAREAGRADRLPQNA
jgi:hypothetical protein